MVIALVTGAGTAPQEPVARGEISGRVVDEHGTSLPGPAVSVVRVEPIARPIVVSTVASAEGIFRFDALRPGRYLVVVALPGFTQISTLTDVTDHPVELPLMRMPIAGLCDCAGMGLIVKNPEGQGLPGGFVQPQSADRARAVGRRLDSRGQIESGMVGGEVLVIDAPGYGRHRVQLPTRHPKDWGPPFSVTLDVAPELIATAAMEFSPSVPDVTLQRGEVGFGVATTMGDFIIAVDTLRMPPTEASVRRFVASGLPNGGPYRVLTGLDVVHEIQRRRLGGRKPRPALTIIAIKRAR